MTNIVPAPILPVSQTGLNTLADAENLLVRLNRVDLAVRLKKGEVYKTVRDRQLYKQEDYPTFEDWVKYSQRQNGETLSQVNLLIALYEVFVEALGLKPEELKANRITYTALRTILPFVQCARDDDGTLVVLNAEAVIGYLDDARCLSAQELRARLCEELLPNANRSRLKFTRIDLVGKTALVHVEAFDDEQGIVDAGIWKLPPLTYLALKEALLSEGRLILPGNVEPPKLRSRQR